MIETLVALLVLVIVAGLVVWLVRMLPLPEPWGQIATVLIVLVFLLLIVGWFFGGLPAPRLRS